MKIEELKIEGFRNFGSFKIEGPQPKGLVILAGQNGTGKSTILEIVNFLLNSIDTNQLNQDIANGITSVNSIWQITVSMSDDELNYLCKKVQVADPLRFSTEQKVLEDLKVIMWLKNERYFFTRKVTIHPSENPSNGEPIKDDQYILGDESQINIRPRAMEIAMQQKIFCGYYKALENIDLGGMTAYNPRQTEPGQIVNPQDDIKNRSSRTSVNIGTVLNYLASKAVWDAIKSQAIDLSILEKTLSEINQLIFPLEISYNKDLVEENGQFTFTLKNLKNNRTYPLAYASSGEKQMIGLVGTFKYWKDATIKPILLFDEPDLNLHPEYVNRFSEFMGDLLSREESEFTCMVATHSPDLIYWNPDNVFQISPDSTTIEKISNLSERVNLIRQLGKGFSLSYLIKKVIYVEGFDRSNNQLEDTEIYRKLVDPAIKNVTFIPAGIKEKPQTGGKSGTIKRASIVQNLIESLQGESDSLNIFALIDKDGEESKDNKVIQTPYNCVENLFLYNLDLMRQIITDHYCEEFNLDEITDKFPTFATNKDDVDGKEVLEKIYKKLESKCKEKCKGSGKLKGFQSRILEKLKIEDFPENIKIFLQQLK